MSGSLSSRKFYPKAGTAQSHLSPYFSEVALCMKLQIWSKCVCMHISVMPL